VTYLLALLYWSVTRPATQGACVAVWYAGKVLVVRNSYRREYGFPGGFVKKGENGSVSASRELLEEVGLAIASDQLHLAGETTFFHECKEDTASVYEVELANFPQIHVDNREVVEALFLSPDEVLTRQLCPHVRAYLENLSRR
jgi:ADP-ribose pyrophosphatase YjhB (NUDIX family)